jgi:hypothetical protein
MSRSWPRVILKDSFESDEAVIPAGQQWWRLCRRSQVLVHRFPTHAELARNVGLALASGDAAPQVGDLIGGQGGFAAPIGAALLGEGDALALPLAQERSLELGERPHHREHEARHRGVLAGECQPLLDEFDADAAAGELLHQAAKVVEVTGEAIHAMHDYGVAQCGAAAGLRG